MILSEDLMKIILLLKFEYYSGHSFKGSRAQPSDLRRCLTDDPKGAPKFMQRLQQRLNLNQNPLINRYFALIKKPVKIADKSYTNAARGAIAIYDYVGKQDLFNSVLENFKELIAELMQSGSPGPFKNCSSVEIIVGINSKYYKSRVQGDL